MSEVNTFKGYSLFNDVEDWNVRIHNRAVVMANICEENIRNGFVSTKGLTLIVNYFKEIIPIERLAVKNEFNNILTQRGIKYAS